jgi:hypothetical protein
MKDTASAVVLIMLIVDQFLENFNFGSITICVLIVAMIWPGGFKPIAFVWFGFSTALGTIVSKILLSITFFGLVLPVGLVRRLYGADPLKLKEWKKNEQSVFKDRDHLFAEKDLRNPY